MEGACRKPAHRSPKGYSLGTSSPPAQLSQGWGRRAGIPRWGKLRPADRAGPHFLSTRGRGGESLGSDQAVGRILERSVRGPGNWGRHQSHQLSGCCRGCCSRCARSIVAALRAPMEERGWGRGQQQTALHCSALKAGGQRWPSLPEVSCLESREEAHSAAARPPTGRRDQSCNESSSRLPRPRGSASRDRPPKACF